jgi:hypothetical protein
MKTTYRLITLLVLLSILLASVSACASLPAMPWSKPTLTPTVTNTPLPTMPTDPLAPDQILIVAVDRVNRQASYSYSATYIAEGSTGDMTISAKVSIGGAIINPDQSYEKATSKTIVNDKEVESVNREYLHLGDKFYKRASPIGPWDRLATPDPNQPDENAEDNELITHIEVLSWATNITLVGEEKLNKAIDCYHLQFDFDSTQFVEQYIELDDETTLTPTSSVITSDVWVSKNDLFVRHWEFTIPVIMKFTDPEGQADLNYIVTYDFYSFNQPALIPTPFLQNAP